jgi:hypothetical protein
MPQADSVSAARRIMEVKNGFGVEAVMRKIIPERRNPVSRRNRVSDYGSL